MSEWVVARQDRPLGEPVEAIEEFGTDITAAVSRSIDLGPGYCVAVREGERLLKPGKNFHDRAVAEAIRRTVTGDE